MIVMIVAVENAPPFDVIVHRVPEEFLKNGEQLWRRLLATYEHGMATGQWPGMCHNNINHLVQPTWSKEIEEE